MRELEALYFGVGLGLRSVIAIIFLEAPQASNSCSECLGSKRLVDGEGPYLLHPLGLPFEQFLREGPLQALRQCLALTCGNSVACQWRESFGMKREAWGVFSVVLVNPHA